MNEREQLLKKETGKEGSNRDGKQMSHNETIEGRKEEMRVCGLRTTRRRCSIIFSVRISPTMHHFRNLIYKLLIFSAVNCFFNVKLSLVSMFLSKDSDKAGEFRCVKFDTVTQSFSLCVQVPLRHVGFLILSVQTSDDW